MVIFILHCYLIFKSFSKYTFMTLMLHFARHITFIISFPKTSLLSKKEKRKKNHTFRSDVNLILILASSLSFHSYVIYRTRGWTQRNVQQQFTGWYNIIQRFTPSLKQSKKKNCSFLFSVKKTIGSLPQMSSTELDKSNWNGLYKSFSFHSC